VPGTYTVATLLDAVHPVERGWRAFRQCLSRSGRKSWHGSRSARTGRYSLSEESGALGGEIAGRRRTPSTASICSILP